MLCGIKQNKNEHWKHNKRVMDHQTIIYKMEKGTTVLQGNKTKKKRISVVQKKNRESEMQKHQCCLYKEKRISVDLESETKNLQSTGKKNQC